MFESFYGEPRYKPSLTQKQLVDAGYLGRKAGRGYYRYDGSPMPEAQQDADLGRRSVRVEPPLPCGRPGRGADRLDRRSRRQ